MNHRNNAKMAKIAVTKMYGHLWNICMIMTNVLVVILVVVSDLPIAF